MNDFPKFKWFKCLQAHRNAKNPEFKKLWQDLMDHFREKMGEV